MVNFEQLRHVLEASRYNGSHEIKQLSVRHRHFSLKLQNNNCKEIFSFVGVETRGNEP